MSHIKSKNEWMSDFEWACKNGEIEEVRQLCQKKYLELGWADVHLGGNNDGFRLACQYGHLEVIRYLLTSKEFKEQGHAFANLHAKNEDGFRGACEQGHLEIVKYLLTSPELKEAGHTFANLNAVDIIDKTVFVAACKRGDLEIINFILTSPEVIKVGHKCDWHANNEEGFRLACELGQLEIVKYLLASQELKESGHAFANVHAWNDEGFRLACSNEHWDVVRWLVMDYGIEKTSKIKDIIKDYPQVQEYFRAREELMEIKALIKETSVAHPKDEFELKEDERASKKAKKL